VANRPDDACYGAAFAAAAVAAFAVAAVAAVAAPASRALTNSIPGAHALAAVSSPLH